MAIRRLQIVDTHTGGEPTRLLIDGGPDLGSGDLIQRRQIFRDQFDNIRRALIHEPRGNDVLVGAWIGPAYTPEAKASVIFFNNVGYLGMCGHGTIGVAVGLHWLGRIGLGRHLLDTPVGSVAITVHDANNVSFENVPSYRWHHQIVVDVPGHGPIAGDVAYGGNWFFITDNHGQELTPANIPQLLELCNAIKRGLTARQITGRAGGEIDHIELVTRQAGEKAARNFVCCPGGAYDRSPCGTGTSAKLACLASDGVLKPRELWQQTSIIGSRFDGSYRLLPAGADRPADLPPATPVIVPTITGSAYVTAEATLILDPADPFQMGIPS